MRTVVHPMIMGVALAVAMSATALAGDMRNSRIFTEPRLGLGADIPDELMFGEGSEEGPENGSAGTGLSRRSGAQIKIPPAVPDEDARVPILDGWEVDGLQIGDTSGRQTSGPVRPGCRRLDAVLASLLQNGWSGFRRVSIRTRTIAFNAQRRDGAAKRVQVDRCSGEIIHVSASYSD